jgi:hypothetical protein
MKKGDGSADMDDVERVDTVPPPPGEDDAYNAPTRVHSAPPEDLLDAMKEATRLGVPLKPQSLPARTTTPSTSDADPLSKRAKELQDKLLQSKAEKKTEPLEIKPADAKKKADAPAKVFDLDADDVKAIADSDGAVRTASDNKSDAPPSLAKSEDKDKDKDKIKKKPGLGSRRFEMSLSTLVALGFGFVALVVLVAMLLLRP